MQIYLHEVMHVIQREKFHPCPKTSLAAATYYENLWIFYDEYRANRKTYELLAKIYPEPSVYLTTKLLADVMAFAEDVTDRKYYQLIKDEIKAFRSHGNVMTFFDNVKDSIDEASKALVYLYSIIDNYPQYSSHEKKLSGAPFFNQHAAALVGYFRKKYEKDDFDLSDGLDCYKEYMKCFGMEFADREGGLYCHVHNI